MTVRSNSSFFATLRANLAAHAADRRERQALAHDIAEFRTDAERAELFAILDRNASEDSESIRDLHSTLVSAHRL